jgi:hypothetical protein
MSQVKEQPVAPVIEKPITPPSEWTDVCGDHNREVWRTFKLGGDSYGRAFGCGLMFDVTFKALERRNSCGGWYEGHAEGDLIKEIAPTAEMLQASRQLKFDTCKGRFIDWLTGAVIKKCKLLILKNGVHAAYVP